jgi:hypothetical protein
MTERLIFGRLGVIGLQGAFGLPKFLYNEERCRKINRHASRPDGPLAELCLAL